MVDKLSAGESMEEDCETMGRIGGFFMYFRYSVELGMRGFWGPSVRCL